MSPNTDKVVQLTKGEYAIVDNDDYLEINRYKWSLLKVGSKKYAVRCFKINNKQTYVYLHRLIMKTPHNLQVDHINGNGLDCRKINMRNCTQGENNKNVLKYGKNKFKGVTLDNRNKTKKTWIAQISSNKKHIFLGRYSDVVDAAKRYDEKAVELFGEYAKTNKGMGLL